MLAFAILLITLHLIPCLPAQFTNTGYSCLDACSTVPTGVTTCLAGDDACECKDPAFVRWGADCIGVNCPVSDFEYIANFYSEYCAALGARMTLSVSQFVSEAKTAAAKGAAATRTSTASTASTPTGGPLRGLM
jgi:hypothetical protein